MVAAGRIASAWRAVVAPSRLVAAKAVRAARHRGAFAGIHSMETSECAVAMAEPAGSAWITGPNPSSGRRVRGRENPLYQGEQEAAQADRGREGQQAPDPDANRCGVVLLPDDPRSREQHPADP